MPQRPFAREQAYLVPPSLDDWLPPEHPARFAAAFVDELTPSDWAGLGVAVTSDPVGAARFAPRLLLAVWVYGFMTGVRSSRGLELACREQVPFLWLAAGQHPDHNTLWRFYREHRPGMQGLLQRTVRTAVAAGLVDLALQAVDGTKVRAAAATDRTLDAGELAALLARTEAAIAELEARNTGEDEPPPPRLPAELAQATALRARVRAALAVAGEDGQGNVTDPDATLMQTRDGVRPAYNAQAVVVPLAPAAGRGGRLITATAVTTAPDDHGQLEPMVVVAATATGRVADVTLADAGYHSGATVAACAAAGWTVVMPEAQTPALTAPYHKEAFAYDAATDTYTCPTGQPLTFRGVKRRLGRPEMRVYRGTAATCRACSAFGVCTRDARQGRALEVGPHETALRSHRAWMETAPAQAFNAQRKTLPEPVFGILKERHRARRVLLRGLANVATEWTLVATAFNLRTLARVWQDRVAMPRLRPIGAC
jgi:transposase